MKMPEIDLSARRRTAEVFRHFAAGRLTNDEMEESLPASYEHALTIIHFLGVWPFYDDTYEHKLDGKHRLTDLGRHHFARIVLFLRSDLPFRWPHATGWRSVADVLLSAATLFFYRPGRQRLRACGGERAVWPFFTRHEYDAALRRPPYLAGVRTT